MKKNQLQKIIQRKNREVNSVLLNNKHIQPNSQISHPFAFTILIIDDDELTLLSLRSLLENIIS